MKKSDGDGNANGDEKNEEKPSDEAELQLEEVCKDLKNYTGKTGTGQAFEKLTKVYEELSLIIMNAVMSGSVPRVDAVFEAMVSALDDDQLTRAFARGNPRKNLRLLLLAAEEGDGEVFDAVLGVLHRVGKVAHKSVEEQNTNEHSGGREFPPDSPGEMKGDLTLLQAIYSGNGSAVKTWIEGQGKSKQQEEELTRFHAGMMTVMHAALVGPRGMVPDLLNAIRNNSAAKGENHDVPGEVMKRESWERFFDLLFLGGYEYGRAALMDAALNEGQMSFIAVAEILDKELDEAEAIKMLGRTSFDGSDVDDDLRAYGVPKRIAVAAWVAKLSHVLSINKMPKEATKCLEAELDEMDSSSLRRGNRGDHWSRRLSFLLACGATVSAGAQGNLDKISGSLGLDHLEKSFKEAISFVDNPFIPGMMLVLSLAMEAPNAKENDRRKLDKLRDMVEELLLEVFERLPQTVQGFDGGATACSILFEPETIQNHPESFKGPLRTAFSDHRLVKTFCTQPLIVDFISHTFGAGLLNPRAEFPSDTYTPEVAKWVLDWLKKHLEKNQTLLFPRAPFILVGIVAMPFTYYRVPLFRMWLDFAVFLILLFVYTVVVRNMYDRTLVNALEIALGFYVIAAIFAEARVVVSKKREYFRDIWNFLDVPALFLLAAGFVVRLLNALDSDATGRVGEAFYLLAAPLLYSRILFFAQIFPSQGALIQVIIRMVSKMFRFAIILIVVMTGFVLSFWASLERFADRNEDETETFEIMWIAVFKAMLGDFADIEALTPDPDWVDIVVFVLYLVVITVMLLNLLIAISTADVTIEERAETEIKASRVRTMEHYRRVVSKDVLPAPLNLFQLLALFPIWIIDLCGSGKQYDRLKPTIGRIMGSFVFWVTSGPVAIILGSLFWYVSTPIMVISHWDKTRTFFSLAVVLEHLIVVPVALLCLWAFGAVTSARQIWDMSKKVEHTVATSISFSSDTGRVESTAGEILMRTGGGLGVHQLSLCLEDPMSDPMVLRDEESRPTTVKHIKLLRNRLEETHAARIDNLKAQIESALNGKEKRLEGKISEAITSTKDIQSKLDAVLRKLETS